MVSMLRIAIFDCDRRATTCRSCRSAKTPRNTSWFCRHAYLSVDMSLLSVEIRGIPRLFRRNWPRLRTRSIRNSLISPLNPRCV